MTKDASDPTYFTERQHENIGLRPGDIRTEYQRDRARIIHSAAFRRLQAKTQVMGVGEGDFHRTRLTHSIECAQIGNGLLQVLLHDIQKVPTAFQNWMPCRDLIEGACFAHDIGHPPFGHGGEVALHQQMRSCGGFEGNGQTLRIISKLEKYKDSGQGINPTRRTVLAILKYPAPYSAFDPAKHPIKPPKCYLDEDHPVVDWCLKGFSDDDRKLLSSRDPNKDRTKHHSFDCSLMELADDIAYGVHDIEDIVARGLADVSEVEASIDNCFSKIGGSISSGSATLDADTVCKALFGGSYERKQMVAQLVNLFVTNVQIDKNDSFEHPLLAFNAHLPQKHNALLEELKGLSFKLVIQNAPVQQLEQRGQRFIAELFNEMKSDPEKLIPRGSWEASDTSACVMRRVCDYIAGMTDSYAEKVYKRMFVPGFGSSSDEL